VIDIVATQRVIVDLVLDDEVRQQWESDPTGFAQSRLGAAEAAMIAGLDPVGIRAMAESNAGKKVRFDHLHAVHHAFEDAKLERLTGIPHVHGQPVGPDRHSHEGHSHDGHSHDGHSHDGHSHDGHSHDHGVGS